MFGESLRKLGMAAALIYLTVAEGTVAQAALLFQDGFNYNLGSFLASNGPWGGSIGSALSIGAGDLYYTTLRGISPGGTSLLLGPGTGSVASVNFTNIAITSGDVYCSFLMNVATAPARSSFVAALLPSESTAASQPNDPLDFGLRSATGGYILSLGHTGVDSVSTSTALPLNSTHLIVLKYTFGNYGRVGVYVDPVVGQPEPTPDAATQAGDDDGSDAPNLQVLLLASTGSSGQGAYTIDTLRVGTTWADVTPVGMPVAITGPGDEAICAGSAATFSVMANGSPPLVFQWRTNGVDVPSETNATYTLPNSTASDTQQVYDIVVTGPYGSATSAPALLSISYAPPQVVQEPSNAIIWPGVTNVAFSALASGDSPLSFQWRSNGTPIEGATNHFYTLTNVSAMDSSNVYDLVASNPCGEAVSLPVSALFAHTFLVSEGLPAFFSGLNLITTNSSGQALFAWSSSDLSLPVATWFLEGQLSEQPLNDGTGNSIYSINVNPANPLVYYLIGAAVEGPFVSPAAVNAVATDALGNYTFAVNNYPITSAGLLILPGSPPPVVIQTSSSGVQVTGLGAPDATIWLQATSSLTPPIDWVTIATNTAASDGSINFNDTISGMIPGRFYRLVLP